MLLLRLKTAFPFQGAKRERQTKVFYTSIQRLFQTKSLMFMPVQFCHEMRTSFHSLGFETMQMQLQVIRPEMCKSVFFLTSKLYILMSLRSTFISPNILQKQKKLLNSGEKLVLFL